MAELTVRPMTAAEFGPFQTQLIEEYAADNVRAGHWPARGAAARAAREVEELLPDGLETADVLLLCAEGADEGVVGRIWITLVRPGGGAWIHDIVVVPQERGKGYGRALLRAAEDETARRGIDYLGLNVFGDNAVARALYESAGYVTTSLQMRKRLDGQSGVTGPRGGSER